MAENLENYSLTKDEVSFKEVILNIKKWWVFLLSNKKTLIAVGVIGAILGLTYSLIKKPVYKAELSFALQDEKAGGGGLSGAAGIAGQLGIDLGGGATGGEFSGDNLIELMKSRSMVTRALLIPITINKKKTTLAEYYIDFNGLRKKWFGKSDVEDIHFIAGADTSKFSLTQDSVLSAIHQKLIGEHLTVDKKDKKLSIINVKVNSANELFSKYFAEILTKVVADFYIQTKTEKAAKNVAILRRQTDSVRKILYSFVSGVAVSADVNPNPNPLLQVLRVPSQTKQIGVTTNTAIFTQLVTNLEVAKMNLLQATPLIQIVDKPILPLEKERLGKIRGIVSGGFLFSIFAAFFLSIRFFFRQVILNEN